MENLTTDTFEDGGKMEIDVHDLIGNVPDFDKYVRSYHRTFFLDDKKWKFSKKNVQFELVETWLSFGSNLEQAL